MTSPTTSSQKHSDEKALLRFSPVLGLYLLFSTTFVHILQQEGLASWGWKAIMLIGAPTFVLVLLPFFRDYLPARFRRGLLR